jgi:hypothetical protein
MFKFFYKHRYFGFLLNVRDTPCDRSCKVTVKLMRGSNTWSGLHNSKILHLLGNKPTKTEENFMKTKATYTILIIGFLVFF